MVADDCFIDSKMLQIFDSVIGTLEFKMFPGTIFHDQIKVLKIMQHLLPERPWPEFGDEFRPQGREFFL